MATTFILPNQLKQKLETLCETIVEQEFESFRRGVIYVGVGALSAEQVERFKALNRKEIPEAEQHEFDTLVATACKSSNSSYAAAFNTRKSLAKLKSASITFWLIVVEGDVDPTTIGPFATELLRDQAAWDRHHADGHNGFHDGFYILNVSNNIPSVDSYTGGFMDGPRPRSA